LQFDWRVGPVARQARAHGATSADPLQQPGERALNDMLQAEGRPDPPIAPLAGGDHPQLMYARLRVCQEAPLQTSRYYRHAARFRNESRQFNVFELKTA